MKSRRVAALFLAGAIASTVGGGTGHAGSSLSRSDQPAILKGSQVPTLLGSEPSDIVAFAYADDWSQIPVQVDEVKMFDIVKAYPATVGPCSDPCYSWTGRKFFQRVYADENTLTGGEVDEVINGVTNSSTLDADDEIVTMIKDSGAQAPAQVDAPEGVVGNGLEVALSDPLDGGVGYIYLFLRDADANPVLDPSAGVSYVDYHWVVNHIRDNHPGDPEATYNHYKNEYRFTGYKGTQSGAGNPESSYVQTAHYRREWTGRWTDNVMKVFRGSATGVNFLDRHDESISFDQSCVRYQGTFDKGEMTYITSKSGPIRAIRDFLGTNSGPLTQRQDIFYESSTTQRIDLRVHVIPGASEFFAYNANATGLRYTEPLGTARIDGLPDPYTGHPAILPGTYTWETVDKDWLTPLPTDPPAAGALTFVNYFTSNNFDPIAHTIWRDGGTGGCGNRTYYGTALAQGPLVLNSTDVNSNGTQGTNLQLARHIHYEAPGTANGPVRQAQDTTPLTVTATDR